MSESTIFMKLSLSTKHDLLASGVSFRQSTAKNGGAITHCIHAFLNYFLTIALEHECCVWGLPFTCSSKERTTV